jgi:hypothetical protein
MLEPRDRDEDVWASWEGEGGNLRTTPRASGGHGYAPYYPSLPAGYSAQLTWGFRERTGRFTYDFHRVYTPAVPLPDGRLVVVGRLDADRSYWVVTWSAFSETGDEHPAGRWVSYAQACKRLGSHLNFERFSSSIQMREELPTLLNVGGVPLESLPAVTHPARYPVGMHKPERAGGAVTSDILDARVPCRT